MLLDKAAHFLFEPGISVVKEARIIMNSGDVHAMHDPTEGGVATGLHEMMEAANCGAVIKADTLSVYTETSVICEKLQIDPLGLIASGALLAAVAIQDCPGIIQALKTAGISAMHIGTVTENPDILIESGNNISDLPRFARDELARIFE